MYFFFICGFSIIHRTLMDAYPISITQNAVRSLMLQLLDRICWKKLFQSVFNWRFLNGFHGNCRCISADASSQQNVSAELTDWSSNASMLSFISKDSNQNVYISFDCSWHEIDAINCYQLLTNTSTIHEWWTSARARPFARDRHCNFAAK